jgi:hypothetical protein
VDAMHHKTKGIGIVGKHQDENHRLLIGIMSVHGMRKKNE